MFDSNILLIVAEFHHEKKHLYRTLLIWGAIILSILVVYPTISWMSLEETDQNARIAKWAEEDKEWADESQGYFSELAFSLKRWARPTRITPLTWGSTSRRHPDGGELGLAGHSRGKAAGMREEEGMSDTEIAELAQETIYEQLVNRINEFEAKEPVIQKLGTDQILAQLPGAKDTDRAVELMTKTALLNFNVVAGRDETLPGVQRA